MIYLLHGWTSTVHARNKDWRLGRSIQERLLLLVKGRLLDMVLHHVVMVLGHIHLHHHCVCVLITALHLNGHRQYRRHAPPNHRAYIKTTVHITLLAEIAIRVAIYGSCTGTSGTVQ
jgi:hypothetical protein